MALASQVVRLGFTMADAPPAVSDRKRTRNALYAHISALEVPEDVTLDLAGADAFSVACQSLPPTDP
jgi:hypothetical protein